MMRGINPYYEEAMSGFQDLLNVVDRLIVLGLSENEGQIYKTAINTSLSYIKNHFPYNLKWESDIPSHCVNYGLSERQNKVSWIFKRILDNRYVRPLTSNHGHKPRFSDGVDRRLAFLCQSRITNFIPGMYHETFSTF